MGFSNAKKFAVGVSASALLLVGGLSNVADAKGKVHKNGWTATTPIHIKNDATSTYVNGYAPSQLRKAYGLDKLSSTGVGETIAIVDAYGSPTISQDMNTFDQQFNLPAVNLQVAYPSGKPNKTDGGWALETAMDVEWAHSMSPDASIMVVVAKSASISDLLAAEDYASTHGAAVVSNSWGGSEFSSQTSYDSHFQHAGVTYLASSGDSGAGSSWPAASEYVVGVGGTTLNIDQSDNYLSETAWSGSGGGTSSYVSRPSYQNNWQSIVGSSRGIPDVAFDADPNTGVAVYSSTRDQGQSGWFQVGGTSLGSPSWAGMIALSDQSRTTSLTSLDVLNKLYSIAGTTNSSGYNTNFHDITQGNDGGYNAQAGYDLVTGLGSPVANQLLPTLGQ